MQTLKEWALLNLPDRYILSFSLPSLLRVCHACALVVHVRPREGGRERGQKWPKARRPEAGARARAGKGMGSVDEVYRRTVCLDEPADRLVHPINFSISPGKLLVLLLTSLNHNAPACCFADKRWGTDARCPRMLPHPSKHTPSEPRRSLSAEYFTSVEYYILRIVFRLRRLCRRDVANCTL